MKFRLIEGWKKSYKLYSVQISVLILIWSILDGLLRMRGDFLPPWFYTLSAVGLLVSRNIKQFFDD